MSPTEKMIRKIFIIDDQVKDIELFSKLLQPLTEEDYRIFKETDPEKALQKIQFIMPEIILLDVVMPKINGVQLLAKLKETPETADIPVIMISTLEHDSFKLKALELGVTDFLRKPFNAAELNMRIRNILKIKEFSDYLKNEKEILEKKVEEKTVEIMNAFMKLDQANKKVQEAYLDTIFRLTVAAEYMDGDTATHIKRVSESTKLMAELLGLKPADRDLLFYAAPMHDIGKIGIPDNILQKPAALTPEEFDIMKSHTTIGEKILAGSKSDIMETGAVIAVSHHEKFDGSGYPYKLKGEKIPLAGRVMVIIDIYDALRSARPYKPGFTHKKTLEIITIGDGRVMPHHFDPEVLSLFEKNNEKFNDIFSTWSGKKGKKTGLEVNL